MSDVSNVEELLESWELGVPERHPHRSGCECGQDLNRVGLTHIVYSFEECNCAHVDNPHLIEVLRHRACAQPFTCDVFHEIKLRGKPVPDYCSNCGRVRAAHSEGEGP